MKPRYKPTRGDLAFDKAHREDVSLNDFEHAVLLQDVSDAYLAVMILDHSGGASLPEKALIEFELQRRSQRLGVWANHIAIVSAVVAILSAILSGIAVWTSSLR